jgi:hypothetical protein
MMCANNYYDNDAFEGATAGRVDLSSCARAFLFSSAKNLLHVLQLVLCAIHSLIEKDQKVCFRKVWQVVAPLLIYVPFSVC